MSQLCARLNKHEVVLARLFRALCFGNFAFVCEIGFVADEDDDDVVAALTSNVVDPLPCLFECFNIYEMVN